MKMARDTGSLSENVNYAVKSSHLLAFLEGLTETASLPVSTTAAGLAAAADSTTIQQVKDATVFITVQEK